MPSSIFTKFSITKCLSSYSKISVLFLWTYHIWVVQIVSGESSGLRSNPSFNRPPPPTSGHYVNPDFLSPPSSSGHSGTTRFRQPLPLPIAPLPGCDSCVYGGHNATCVRISGLFTRPTLPVGYNVITKIPTGACAIEVSEMRISKNYLALRDEKGNYVVNGRWNIDRSGHYPSAGTVFTYRRHDPRRNRGESLTAPGPLTEAVLLLVIYQQPNPGISYEYSIPLHNASFRNPPMVMPPPLEQVGSDPPSVSPASPRHHRRHRNERNHNHNRSQPPPLSSINNDAVLTPDLTPSISFPSGFDPPKRPATQTPPKKQNRGKGKKTYRWQVLDDTLTECSVTCGKGFQSQVAVCVRVTNNPKDVAHGQFHTVDERHCRGVTKPNLERLVCNTNIPCTPGRFGTKPDAKTVPHTPASNIPYSETGMVWKPDEWGPCSASCGTGIRARIVTCVDLSPLPSRGHQDLRCDELHKPADSEPCYAAPCAPIWLASTWDIECSHTCGPDQVRRRRVICSDQLPRDGDSSDRSRSFYDDSIGNVGKCERRKRPTSEESCHSVLKSQGIDCSHVGQWMTSAWSQCSSTCGVPGWQTRSVVCLVQSRLSSSKDSCSGQEEPLSRQPCNPGIPCPPPTNELDRNDIPGVWFTSEWKNCSHPCGGTQDRDVICLSTDGRTVVHNCPLDERPQHKRSCNADEENGDKICDDVLCVDKDPHCHLVARARLCHYEHYRTRCCQSCELVNNNKKAGS